MGCQTAASDRITASVLSITLLVALFVTSRYNYLLFHSLVELFSVVVACAVFVIAWNSRRFMANNYLLFIGIASLFVAIIDLIHVLSYKNMGVFPLAGANLPTQLWVAERYLQSISFLVAPFLFHRAVRPATVVFSYAVVTALLLTAVFTGYFPDCYVEGSGLTPFKIGSEYLCIGILLASLIALRSVKQAFDPGVFRLLVSAVTLLILAGAAFTLYRDVYGMANMTGHLCKVLAYYLIYRALIKTGLTHPYNLLFRELKQSEERYRALYENTPVMLHSIDREGNLVNVSNYWLEQMGYAREEVLGEKTVSFMTEESRRYALETALPTYYQTGFSRDVPYRFVKKDGSVMEILLSAAAERDGAGEIVRSLSVLVDVTERKRAEMEIESLNARLEARNHELEGVNRELDAFNSSVSHDLRRPLTNISSYSQLTLECYGPVMDEQFHRFVTGIYDETKRMDRLIDTLLKFARLSRTTLACEKFDLSAMVTGIVAELAVAEPERRVTVSIAPEMSATGDSNLVRVALQNLIGNSWKYTGTTEDAEIEIGRCERDGRCLLFVRDNGVGFDPKESAQLFEPFQRLSSASGFEGNGIGLATVQRIIERHNGFIQAEGMPGEGATFYCYLPEQPAAGVQT